MLDRAGREAPDDDRVWLGKASLATLEGRFAEAATWLDRCTRRRPDDPAVWRARLNLALASGNAEAARRAWTHLPARLFDPSEILAIRSWFLARAGDLDAERNLLERRLTVHPGDTEALERLADLASREGLEERLAELRRRKAELDRDKERYRKLMAGSDLPSHAAELARLAGNLGRRAEAIGWATLAVHRNRVDADSRRLLTRLRQSEPTPPPEGSTLAEILADLGPSRVRSTVETQQAILVPRFVDDAQNAGLGFVFDPGRSPLRELPTTMCGGIGLIDLDDDGWLDVYAVQAGTYPPPAGRSPAGDRLFRNKRDGTFEDVTKASGLSNVRDYGLGVTVGDIDNDGHEDLFLTRLESYALYRNKGDGTFEDVTEASGLGGTRAWPTSSTFADIDGDGDLDLYVAHYLRWDSADPRICRHPETQAYTFCDPRLFDPLPDHLFRNDGGRFVDVTDEAGIVDREGRGLGVLAADLDEDGKIDLFVANDTTANLAFHNLGGGRFEEIGMASGVATNASGGYLAGMGIACGDLDADGRLDLAVTNFYGESTTFYHAIGGALFSDRTAAIGLAIPSRYRLGFGIAFVDANNDGRLDVLTANGHVNDFRPVFPYEMPAQLLLGGEDGKLVDVSERAGLALLVPRVGRGLAVGDLDNDGRQDALLVDLKGPLAYLHNQTDPDHTRFLTLQLEGTATNRDAIGARVRVVAGGKAQVAQRFGGGSYLSSSDPRLHFGLGSAHRVDLVEVVWPSGRVDRFRNLAVDHGYRLREGDPSPRALAGFGKNG